DPVEVGSYRHGALLQSQAGARTVSQPSAPDRLSLPMIGLSYASTRADSRLTDSAAPKLLEGAAWKFKPRPTGVEPVRRSASSEPLRRRVRPRVVRALTPVASAGRGRERRVAVRALFGSRRGRGFVSLRRAQPSIPESEKKRAGILVGRLLRACRALGRLLPAISDLLPHDAFPLWSALGSRASPLEAWRANSPNAPSSQVRRGALGSSE